MQKNTILIMLSLVLVSMCYLGTNFVIKQHEQDRSVVVIDTNTEKKILFYREDCPDCQQVYNHYYWHNFVHDDVQFVNLNQVKNRHYISRYKLRAVPTVVFKNISYVGIDTKKIEEFLNQE